MHVQMHFAPLYVPCKRCKSFPRLHCRSKAGYTVPFHAIRRADAPKTREALDALIAERRQLATV